MEEPLITISSVFNTLTKLAGGYCVVCCLQKYQNLLKSAGFRLEQENPIFADISILEATCI